MMNDKRSHGLWERTAPPPPRTQVLDTDLTADVAIIGGGFTGMSAALHLAEAGARVVLLEAVEIGFGASGRNAGLVNAGMWVMPDALEETLGPTYGKRLLTLLGNAPRVVFDIVEKHAIDCEIENTGTLHCALGKKGLAQMRARAKQWQAHGAPVRLLDAAETMAKTGTDVYAGALLDLRAGTIQPLAYVRGLARAAIAAGARIFTDSIVTSTQRDGDQWQVRTPGGSVRAKWVIAATDAYTGKIWPELRTEQAKLPYFNVATAPLSDNVRRSILPDRQGAWDTRTILTHFRLDHAGRLIIGSIGALRGTGASVHRGWARRHIHELFPQLDDVALEHEWYGTIGMTDDHLPRLHMLDENVLAFSGYNGRGIGPGTTFGRELARYILGEVALDDMVLPVTPPKAIGLRAAREVYYEYGSQIAHLPHPPVRLSK